MYQTTITKCLYFVTSHLSMSEWHHDEPSVLSEFGQFTPGVCAVCGQRGGTFRCASSTNREIVLLFSSLRKLKWKNCRLVLTELTAHMIRGWKIYFWIKRCTCISCKPKSLPQHKDTVSPNSRDARRPICRFKLPTWAHFQMSRPLSQRELDGLEARQKQYLHGVEENNAIIDSSPTNVFFPS